MNFSMLDRLREVVVALTSDKGGEVTLHVSYIVYQASWTPKYDMRVFTDEKVLKVNPPTRFTPKSPIHSNSCHSKCPVLL